MKTFRSPSLGLALGLGLSVTIFCSVTLFTPGCSVDTEGLFGPGTGPDPDGGDGGGGSDGGGGEGGMPPSSTCGNNVKEKPEACDGSDLDGQTCKSLVGESYSGTLKCLSNCTFDTSTCVPPATCGNGTLDGDEQCEGSKLGGKTCATVLGPGYTGDLSCTAACTFNTSACKPPPICGDGLKNGSEECEGSDLGSATCASVKGPGYTGGLSCTAACKFDTSACKAPPACGDGVKNGSELCDGSDVGSATCATILGPGYTGGLACKPDCTYNTSACVAPPICGDGVKNGSELCDGSDLGTSTCASVLGAGHVGGLTCKGDCTFNTSACVKTCSPGTSGTPSSVSASGVTQTSAYLRDNLGAESYSALSPATIPLASVTLPGQIVLSGLNGLSITFTGGDPVLLYTVNASAVSECAGVNYYSFTCEAKVAKDFRCTYFPAGESGCDIKAIFTALPPASSYSSGALGNNKILASLICK